MNHSVRYKFDGAAVAEGVRKGSLTALRRAGAYTRKVAQNLIKVRRNRDLSSKSGTPPFAHGAGKNLKKSILFGVDKADRSVVIGPSAMSGDARLAKLGALHEFGGMAENRQPAKSSGTDWNTAKAGPVRVAKGVIVFGKLRTAAQRKRAWRIEASGARFPNSGDAKAKSLKRLMAAEKRRQLAAAQAAGGGRRKREALYPARPFMNPAMQKVKPMLPALWSGVVKS